MTVNLWPVSSRVSQAVSPSLVAPGENVSGCKISQIFYSCICRTVYCATCHFSTCYECPTHANTSAAPRLDVSINNFKSYKQTVVLVNIRARFVEQNVWLSLRSARLRRNHYFRNSLFRYFRDYSTGVLTKQWQDLRKNNDQLTSSNLLKSSKSNAWPSALFVLLDFKDDSSFSMSLRCVTISLFLSVFAARCYA